MHSTSSEGNHFPNMLICVLWGEKISIIIIIIVDTQLKFGNEVSSSVRGCLVLIGFSSGMASTILGYFASTFEE